MFGECHAHVIMDGKNYKAAVALHKERPNEAVIREHLSAWQQGNMALIIGHRFSPFTGGGITVGSWACPLMTERGTGIW